MKHLQSLERASRDMTAALQGKNTNESLLRLATLAPAYETRSNIHLRDVVVAHPDESVVSVVVGYI